MRIIKPDAPGADAFSRLIAEMLCLEHAARVVGPDLAPMPPPHSPWPVIRIPPVTKLGVARMIHIRPVVGVVYYTGFAAAGPDGVSAGRARVLPPPAAPPGDAPLTPRARPTPARAEPALLSAAPAPARAEPALLSAAPAPGAPPLAEFVSRLAAALGAAGDAHLRTPRAVAVTPSTALRCQGGVGAPPEASLPGSLAQARPAAAAAAPEAVPARRFVVSDAADPPPHYSARAAFTWVIKPVAAALALGAAGFGTICAANASLAAVVYDPTGTVAGCCGRDVDALTAADFAGGPRPRRALAGGSLGALPPGSGGALAAVAEAGAAACALSAAATGGAADTAEWHYTAACASSLTPATM